MFTDTACVHRVVTAQCAPRNDVLGHRMVAFHTHADSQGRCTLRTPCGDSSMRHRKRCSQTPRGGISYTCCLSGTMHSAYIVWRQLDAHPETMYSDTAWWHIIFMLTLRDDALCVHRVATARCAPRWWHTHGSSGWPTRYVFLVQLDQRDDKKNKKLK